MVSGKNTRGIRAFDVDTDQMIRVDQAGEFGANRIYAGQLAVMGDRHPLSGEIRHMAAQEERHRAEFDAMMAQRGVRPSLLQPFWSLAGYALGAGTALLGPEAAMACTAAVEEEIDRHYSAQLDALGAGKSEGAGEVENESYSEAGNEAQNQVQNQAQNQAHYQNSIDPELSEKIAEFREEEREHRDAALAAGAEQAPAYPLLSGAIRMGCRAAIKLAERI